MKKLSELVSNTNTASQFFEIHTGDMRQGFTHLGELTLIEHIAHYSLTNERPDALKQAFIKLQSFSTDPLIVVRATRLVVRLMILVCDLSKLDNIQKNLETYFPDPDESLRDLFIRTSYRIRIGQTFCHSNDINSLPDLNSRIQSIRSMANHSLYSTNRNPVALKLNHLTAEASKRISLPGFFQNDRFASLTEPLAATYDYYTSTSRTLALTEYAATLSTLIKKGVDLLTIPENHRKAHIDLLSFLYFEGNENLKKDIVFRLDNFIEQFRSDGVLLHHILQTFAPEPLGKMMYGMHAHSSNILQAIKPDNYLALLKAYPDQTLLQPALEHVNQKFVPYTANIVFDEKTDDTTRWAAYLLTMGHYPLINVTVTCEAHASLHDHMLFTYIEEHKRIDKNVITATIDHEKQCTDQEIIEMMKSQAGFSDEIDPVHRCIKTINGIEIEFTLTQTAIVPGGATVSNDAARNEFIRLLILAFQTQWEQLPKQEADFVRPFAVEEHRHIDKLHCAPLKPTYPQWLLVYSKDVRNNNRFLYDIVIHTSHIEPGLFTKLSYGNVSTFEAQFPDLVKKPGYIPSRGRSFSNELTEGKSAKDRSPSPSKG